ncbi:prephenate dehydratase domain-containing protein [Streptomyces sp. NPDC046860]|uniref:prephenate dehydratase domain-containing protein n=1 Tax=Streptomyces sp. NPDC046860 TaxID=3154495 RepID=UPI003408623A
MISRYRSDVSDGQEITDVALFRLPLTAPLRITSLGPAGTSSEQACRALQSRLLQRGHESVRIDLCDRYEEAADRLVSGAGELAVVANAYAGIERFYMDPALRLAAVFVKDTPHYGIAARPGAKIVGKASVVTHPAPRALIGELLPDRIDVAEVVFASSTSAAARSVAEGEVPLALTTAPAARLHGLEFLSRTRPIRMVWSAFTRADLLDEDLPGRPARSARSLAW